MPNKKGKTKGLTIIYTGEGKGKTTAAFGLALRAAGRKKKVLIVQFLKSDTYGEHAALKNISGITVKICGKGFCKIRGDKYPLTEHKKSAQNAMKKVRRAFSAGTYDMVILDEINVALHCRLISIADVVTLIEKKPAAMHVVLTGRDAPRALITKADLVSEVRDIKHPYRNGIRAQEGIEF